MKLETSLNNHEIWCKCPKCGQEYDQRLYGIICPKCGATDTHEVDLFIRVMILVLALAVILISFSSCTALKYKQRRHQNRVFQEVQQHQNSISANKDWTRMYRNWDRRPKGHWPFEFLQ